MDTKRTKPAKRLSWVSLENFSKIDGFKWFSGPKIGRLKANSVHLVSEGEFFKNLVTWNRFHGVNSNCGIKSKLASIPKVGAGLDKGIPCYTLALGWR